MFSKTTLMIIPVLNYSQYNKFFLQAIYGFSLRYGMPTVLFLKDIYPENRTTIRKMFNDCDSVTLIFDNYPDVKVSDGLNRVCATFGKEYEELIITEPHVLFSNLITGIFDNAKTRAGWSSISFPGRKLTVQELKSLDFEDITFKSWINYTDLGDQKPDIIMFFYDKTYRISDYRVILCKGSLFETFEFKPGLNYDFIGKFAQEIGLEDEGLSLYVHKFNTFFTER